MIVLGIDPATSCGWAVRLADGSHVSGVWDLKGSRFEGAGMRYLRARRYFCALIDTFPADVVALEEVRRHKGTDAAHIYGGIIGQIAAICEEREIPYFAIPVGTVKKLATGKGNASKDDMVDAARERWPDAGLVSDDECDARWIAEAAWEELR